MNFPQRPRSGSSSAGVLGKDNDKGEHDVDGNFNYVGNPRGGNGSGLRSNGTRRAWLQRPISRQTVSVSNHRKKADLHFGESSVPREPNNYEEHESHDSSSHT